MPTIKVFEGPLCCNTGVCGPDPDQALVAFSADVEAVRTQGGNISRANLAQDPPAFAADPLATGFLQTAGAQALPLVVVDGVTVAAGRYPTRVELAQWAGVAVETEGREELALAGGCCDGQSEADCCAGEAKAAAEGCCAGETETAAEDCCGEQSKVDTHEACCTPEQARQPGCCQGA